MAYNLVLSDGSGQPSDCAKNVILSEAKDLKWPKNEILRYTQNDKKREKCFFTQSAVPVALKGGI
ncbi:MAG: hypothetical protein ACOCG5_03770 [Candidatus Alkaliphilus sp. MAG34]|nr:hypothetical protein [Clostridiales bacterium]